MEHKTKIDIDTVGMVSFLTIMAGMGASLVAYFIML